MNNKKNILKLKSNFNRKLFEIKYKNEIDYYTKKSIEHFLKQSEYFDKNYIFIKNNIIEIFLNNLYNIKFLTIRKKIYELVDDLDIKVSFFDISLREELLKIRLSSENKDLKELSDRGEYKTKKQREKIALKKEEEEIELKKKKNRIKNLKDRIKKINLQLIKQKFKIDIKKNYKTIESLKNFKNINKKFLKHIDFLKEIEAIILEKNKLVSKKYIFLIRNRSIIVFHKEKKQYFSINNIIKFENEIKNLFK